MRYLIILLGVLMLLGFTSASNEALCVSVVSKCMLLRSCECDMTDRQNCTCCHKCLTCLDKLQAECCEYVGK